MIYEKWPLTRRDKLIAKYNAAATSGEPRYLNALRAGIRHHTACTAKPKIIRSHGQFLLVFPGGDGVRGATVMMAQDSSLADCLGLIGRYNKLGEAE